MHLWQDLVYTQVCDPQTFRPRALRPGRHAGLHAPGAHVAADDPAGLGRPALWTDEPCPCGRTYPRLPQGIYGRIDDMFIVRGENIYPSAIEEALRAVPGFGGEFRIIVSRKERMDELLVRAEHARRVQDLAALEKTMRERLQAKCGVRPRLEMLPAGTLPRTEFKARRVIDDCDLYRKVADAR